MYLGFFLIRSNRTWLFKVTKSKDLIWIGSTALYLNFCLSVIKESCISLFFLKYSVRVLSEFYAIGRRHAGISTVHIFLVGFMQGR